MRRNVRRGADWGKDHPRWIRFEGRIYRFERYSENKTFGDPVAMLRVRYVPTLPRLSPRFFPISLRFQRPLPLPTRNPPSHRLRTRPLPRTHSYPTRDVHSSKRQHVLARDIVPPRAQPGKCGIAGRGEGAGCCRFGRVLGWR